MLLCGQKNKWVCDTERERYGFRQGSVAGGNKFSGFIKYTGLYFGLNAIKITKCVI
jgi:hypothetical protein